MPRISFFYGIGIWMYFNEGSHRRPHFHVRYSGHHASVDFDGAVIVGSLPTAARRLVREWGAIHRVELAENWRRGVRGEPLQAVEPLP